MKVWLPKRGPVSENPSELCAFISIENQMIAPPACLFVFNKIMQVGRDLSRSLDQPPAQCRVSFEVSWVLKTWTYEDCINSLGNLLPCFTFLMEKVFFISLSNCSFFQLTPVVSHPPAMPQCSGLLQLPVGTGGWC